uniref:Uncharacterized protein n=1 Tax=Panagrolaimus davidi TaxID=227884 RepID=A0A914QGK6_9BILA
MVAGVLAVDLIKGCFAFTPKQAFNINSSSGDEEFTERYFDDLIVKIENELQGDIGQTVIIAPTSLSAGLKNYFMQKFEDIGIMSKNFIRFETLFVIGALADTKITIAKNETVAVFYYNKLKLIGDQWKKTDDKLIFEKRIFCSNNENGLNKVFSKVPNHILISDKIIKPEKHFPQMKFQIFNEDGDTFLLSAALIKARILMKEAALKGFDAKDIGNMQISETKVINVIGISIGSDTFSIAKYANDKIEIIKNAENEETSKCTVFWKNGQIFLNGNQEGSHKLEYCFDLLGLQSIESREPFTKLNLAENEDAPNTKVCYNINGKIVNPERAALELLKHIKAISGATKDTKIIFSLSSEIKNDPKKCQLFLRLSKEAGFEGSEIVEKTLALCLGGSQNSNKKENGTFIGINVSETKIDASLYRLANNQICDFKEASRDLPPRQNPANSEFVAVLREHLLIIAKTAFDVMKFLNIERTDVDCVLLNYTGKFKETTKEFLQRMFLEKQIIELQPSFTLTAIGAAIYGAI